MAPRHSNAGGGRPTLGLVSTARVITTERHDHVGVLWLDNPERRNAMGPDFWADLPSEMGGLSEDDGVRAVVVAARGPHFSVGLDLKSMGSGEAPAGGGSPASRARHTYREVKRLQAAINSVAECPKPVIAAVHGYCIGGGVDLISACDVRLASSDAVFSVRETKVAIVADLGSLQRLPRLISMGHVNELALTGKDIDAQRALQIGLVNSVHDDHDSLQAAALEMAHEMAANSPLVVEGTKAVLAASVGRSVDEGLDYVAAWNAAFLASSDLSEAMTAFFEKRKPEFTGD